MTESLLRYEPEMSPIGGTYPVRYLSKDATILKEHPPFTREFVLRFPIFFMTAEQIALALSGNIAHPQIKTGNVGKIGFIDSDVGVRI